MTRAESVAAGYTIPHEARPFFRKPGAVGDARIVLVHTAIEEQLLAALQDAQWGRDGRCSICECHHTRGAHAANCRIGLALAAAKEAVQ